ncbi:MAG: CsgG/HfaB family protein [Roseovarius sp.]|uniref:CsgG/HfaB family protein n=1 Tax=Roseovarius sp. TaxID=1486281 RepID=UPI0032EF3023
MTVLLAGAVIGCTKPDPFKPGRNDVPARILPDTQTSAALKNLSAPERKMTLAVYEFPDLTGQHKPSERFAEFSRAVTQGADAILVDVLTKAGRGEWFDVVERRGLTNILRERQIIQATRSEHEGEEARPLNPLTFAGVLIEGGVVAYESNLRTGGLGARYLGIGAHTEYREDYVTVNLRLVSVSSGRVLHSVTTSKQVYSTLVQANVFRFVSSDALLEMDAGFTRNSPPQFALREAIELGVFAMVLEGRDQGLWDFKHPAQGQRAMKTYLERNPNLKARQGTPVVVSRDDTAELFAPMPLADVDARWLEEPLPQDEDRRSLADIRPVARATAAPETARLGPQPEIVAIADIGATETGTN